MAHKYLVIWKEHEVMKTFDSLSEAYAFRRSWTGCHISEIKIYVLLGK